jgi:long-chain acyl-CoA synthetase
VTEEQLPYADALAQITAPGQLFEMEEREIRGVVVRTWKAAPPSLRFVLDLSLGYGDADYIVYEERRVSYAQHYRQAATLAHRLRDELGVQKGDRIAIAMRNLPEWVVAFWAAIAVGAVVVPLNAWWTEHELAYGIGDSGTVVAFVDGERAERLRAQRGALKHLRTIVVADESGVADEADVSGGPIRAGEEERPYRTLLGEVAPDATPPDVTIDPEDDATIFYTSGTTGHPKGAVGTQRNICSNLISLGFVAARAALMATSRQRDVLDGSGTQNAYLLSVPLFHATGCHSILVANTAVGGKLVMMHRWDPERALELIERERITIVGGVPTMAMQILDSPDFAKRDTSSVRTIGYGGAPAPPELVRRIGELFPGRSPSNGYGLTETSSVTTMNAGADYFRKPDSVGPPVPVCDLRVVAAGGEDAPLGEAGELWIRGPNVVRGYWNRPDETAKVMLPDGWLRTGDLGRMDERGFVYIEDRKKDMILVSGFNVYPNEVEAVVATHPGILEAAAVAQPDEHSGEVVALFVIRKDPALTENDVIEFSRQSLAGYKVPKHVYFRKELPKSNVGKILRKSLREELVKPHV